MKKNKKEYMKDETFAELIEAAKQALAYERGAHEGHSIPRVAVSKSSQPVSGKQGASFTGSRRAMRYKGYKGRVALNEDANIYFGEVLNMHDVITFQGTSLEECREAFRSSVNDYLEFCRERSEEPEKPF